MKKIISLCLIIGYVLLLGCTVFAEGGNLTVDFSTYKTTYDNFDFYTEMSGQEFFVNEGYLCSLGRVENKAVLKTDTPLLNYVIEADFHKVNEIAALDAGFYIHASNASGQLDGITAYNINLEKPVKSNSLKIKIHNFEGYYCGELTSVTLTVNTYPIRLKVEVNNENVKVYINDGKTSVIDYNLPHFTPGSVGFRAFRSTPAKISNFKITSPSIPVNKMELNKAIAKAKEITDLSIYTSESANALSNALQVAETLNSLDQKEIDIATENLKNALKNMIIKYSFEELNEKILIAEEIINNGEGVYTNNSYTSLKMVVTRAKKINNSSSETEISYFVELITETINNLIKY